MSASDPKNKRSQGLISTWSIAILAFVALWLGWRNGDQRVIMVAMAGFIAFIVFRFSPTAHVRMK